MAIQWDTNTAIKTANYTAAAGDVVLCDPSGGAFAVTLPSAVATAHAIVQAVEPLLDAIDPTPGVRLLGVSSSNFGAPAEQLTFDDLFAEEHWEAAEQTVDAIRARFGSAAIGPASAVQGSKLRLVRRGAQQWGPDQQPN